MNRRNFLKYLSSIPLIGIPVKLLANIGANTAKAGNPSKYGTTSITPLPKWVKVGDHVDPYDEWIPDDAVSLAEKRNIDPYEDVAEHIYKEYWNDSAKMNADWSEGAAGGVRVKWRRV